LYLKQKKCPQPSPSAIIGYQKWNGAIPAFKINAEITKKINKLHKWALNLPTKNIKEAPAWIKKYFNITSEEKWFLRITSGIKHKILNSIPAHAPNQKVLKMAR